MFFIDKSGGIHITRGDSVTLATELYIEDELADLSDNDFCIVFTVRSKESGNVKIKRLITADNYESGELIFNLSTEETLLTPAKYEYSFLYLPERTMPAEAYTYAQGDFEIMHSVSTYKDLEV